MCKLTTGNNNVAVGTNALFYNRTGGCNVAVGSFALECLFFGSTSATANVAVGFNALRCNVNGTCNVAVGTNSFRLNTTGQNTGLGHNTGCSVTTGYRNTLIGQNAGRLLTTTTNSTVVGGQAGENSTVALTAFGALALQCNTTGVGNTAIGGNAMQNNTTGQTNVAVGGAALLNNTIGDSNTAVGYSSVRNNTTGICSAALGVNALCANTTGRCHIAIGHSAQSALNANVSNTITVGVGAATSATNGHTVWGNANNNVCNCVYAAWSNVSDCRDKANIEEISEEMGLNFIKKLKPVKFNWDSRESYVLTCNYGYGQKDGTLIGSREHYGFIAQQFKETLDDLNIKFDALGYDQEKDAYRITYEELIAPIVKAIQELEKRQNSKESLLSVMSLNRQTSDYTMSLTDLGSIIQMDVEESNNLIISSDSNMNFKIGSVVYVTQYGKGQTNIVGNNDIKIQSIYGSTKIKSQFGFVKLVKMESNVWFLTGDI